MCSHLTQTLVLGSNVMWVVKFNGYSRYSMHLLHYRSTSLKWHGRENQNSSQNLEMTPITYMIKSKFQSLPWSHSCFSVWLHCSPLVFFILGSRKYGASPNVLISCLSIFKHAALHFLQKSSPAGKHSSFMIQFKLYLFLEAFSDPFSVQQKQPLTFLCTLTVHVYIVLCLRTM